MNDAGPEADHERQLALHHEYKGRGPGHRAAYDLLAASLRDMVWGLANFYAKKFRVEADDLFQDGFKDGVIPALESFDSARHCKISTYVHVAVLRAVSRSARRRGKQRRATVQAGGDADDATGLDLLPLADVGDRAEDREAAAKLREVIAGAAEQAIPGSRHKVITLRFGLGPDRRGMTNKKAAKRVFSAERHPSRISQILKKGMRASRRPGGTPSRRTTDSLSFQCPKNACRLMVAVATR